MFHSDEILDFDQKGSCYNDTKYKQEELLNFSKKIKKRLDGLQTRAGRLCGEISL